MGHVKNGGLCRVCKADVPYGNVNVYLDPVTGEVYSLCDKHLDQTMEVDRGRENASSNNG